MKTDVLREFNSWGEFVDCAGDDSLYAWHGKRSSHKHDRNSNWHGTPDFKTALDMALNVGWPEGRKLLHDSIVSINPRPQYIEHFEFSVAGAFPCVPLFCANDPECMVLDPGADHKSSTPVIRIDYNHWVAARVEVKDMMLRGAAIVSLADSLERRGFSTELRIIGNSAAGNYNFRYSIIYKRAGELLDLDRAAFAIAHPSSMRRLAFAILEQHSELERDFEYGYGRPMHQANDPEAGTFGSIFIPGSRGNETVASAQAAIKDATTHLSFGDSDD